MIDASALFFLSFLFYLKSMVSLIVNLEIPSYVHILFSCQSLVIVYIFLLEMMNMR